MDTDTLPLPVHVLTIWNNQLILGPVWVITRHYIKQHFSHFDEEGFLGVIEIENPPSGRAAAVILYYHARHESYHLMEWRDIASAVEAAQKLSSNLALAPNGFDGFICSESFPPGEWPWLFAEG